jgi:hypothetical protein
MILSDSRWGFGLEIGFIDHFNARLVTALNYGAIVDLHTLQITVPYTLVILVCYCLHGAFPGNGSNDDYSSASGIESSPTGGSVATVSSCSSCLPHSPSARITVENPVSNSNSTGARRLLPRETVCLRTLLRNNSTRYSIRIIDLAEYVWDMFSCLFRVTGTQLFGSCLYFRHQKRM